MCLHFVFLESWITFLTPELSEGIFSHVRCLDYAKIKVYAKFQVSSYTGSSPSPMCLHLVFLESWMTFLTPDWSQGILLHVRCLEYAKIKVNTKFQVPSCTGSCPSPMCLHFVILESWRTYTGSQDDF